MLCSLSMFKNPVISQLAIQQVGQCRALLLRASLLRQNREIWL